MEGSSGKRYVKPVRIAITLILCGRKDRTGQHLRVLRDVQQRGCEVELRRVLSMGTHMAFASLASCEEQEDKVLGTASRENEKMGIRSRI